MQCHISFFVGHISLYHSRSFELFVGINKLCRVTTHEGFLVGRIEPSIHDIYFFLYNGTMNIMKISVKLPKDLIEIAQLKLCVGNVFMSGDFVMSLSTSFPREIP